MNVAVHPLVLLSVADHYNRVVGRKNEGRRVVGILLGQVHSNGTINVTNSYAVPFDEDDKNPDVWFLDHDYHDTMADLFKKVNARERPVGWYHTGPSLRANDLRIDQLVRKYIAQPVLVIVGIESREETVPIDGYIAVEKAGESSRWTFDHIPCQIEAEEAEEIGVEHLLRNTWKHSFNRAGLQNKNEPISKLVERRIGSLNQLGTHLKKISQYLEKVGSGEIQRNDKILGYLQDMFNRRDFVHDAEWRKSMVVEGNDKILGVYVGSLVRTMTALYGLIDNKIRQGSTE